MRVSATAKYLRASTRKTRLVTQAIRGKRVEEAAALLRFMPNKAARDVARVLTSATANAENNHNLSAEDLFIVEAVAIEGPRMKRVQPRAQGRAFPFQQPWTLLTIFVADQVA
jgi:large subunit ribosomal protein L22